MSSVLEALGGPAFGEGDSGIQSPTLSTLPPSTQDQARGVSISDWFFRLGDRVLTGVDSHYKVDQQKALANAGYSFGIDASGQPFVLGTAKNQRSVFGSQAPGAWSGQAVGSTGAVGSLLSSPLVLVGAAVALWLILKR